MSNNTYPNINNVYEEQFTPKVNPVTQEQFKRQSWWQVAFPVLVVAALAVLAVVLLIILGGPPALSIVADFSLILLSLIAVLLVLVVLALFGGLVYLMSKLISKTPPYTYKAQMFVENVYRWVDEATDRVADVVIQARAKAAGVNTAMREAGIDIDDVDDPADTTQRIH